MADLSTTYMGIPLKNPLIAGSCGLTSEKKGIKKLEEAGIGAVVLRSLFEEDVENKTEQETSQGKGLGAHAEAVAYMREMGMLLVPDHYLEIVKKIKGETSLPIIASLNCHSADWWVDYAERIEKMGVDALELNIAFMPESVKEKSSMIEDKLLTQVESVSRVLTIPFSIKIGVNYTSLPHFTRELQRRGARGCVLFNRFYRLDVDIEKRCFVPGNRYSSEDELLPVLRWVGILSELLDCDLAVSTGVHTSTGIIKALLTGGTVVQLCSVLYRKGLRCLPSLLEELQTWMEKHNFERIADFQGLLNKDSDQNQAHKQRLQYLEVVRGT